MVHDDSTPVLPAREPRGHKGTFGTVVVVGGCASRGTAEDGSPGTRMIGGPALCALAALRSGAGLVRLAMPEPVLSAGLSIAPEATGAALEVDHDGAIVGHLASAVLDRLMDAARCVVVGPGLGEGEGVRAVAFRAISQGETPVVVDADALNALAEMPEFHRDLRAPSVMTPHVGEFRRLARALGIDPDPEADPSGAAVRLASLLGCVVVLKSAATVVADPLRAWVHDHPNPLLATGGSGDVLAGIIGALVAQHHRKPLGAGSRLVTTERRSPSGGGGGLSLFDAARLAVVAHARAAQRWAGVNQHATAGLLARDLLDHLPEALQSLRAPA